MKSHFSTNFLGVIFLLSLSTTGFSQTTKADIQRMYSEFLVEEGYKPKVDDDGDVVFKYEGVEYYIKVDVEDPMFLKIGRNGVWRIDSLPERERCFEAVNYATKKTKVAKAWIMDDKVHFDIQIFVAKPEGFKLVFDRCMSALVTCFSNFRMKMEE